VAVAPVVSVGPAVAEPAAVPEPVAVAEPTAVAEPAAAQPPPTEAAVAEPPLVEATPAEPVSELSVPVEISVPQAEPSSALDVPVLLADAPSSPLATNLADVGVDLSNLPSSPIPLNGVGDAVGTPLATEVATPSTRRGKRWQPSRTLFFAVTGIACALVLALVVTRRGRPARTVAPVEPASGQVAPPVALAPQPTPEAASPTTLPVADPDEDEPVDPMARPAAGAEDEPDSAEPARPRRTARPTRATPAREGSTPREAPQESEPAAPAGTGTVNVYSTPPAVVFVDGTRLGMTPKQVTLPAGPHTIVVEDATLGRQSVQVDVQPKKQHSVNLTLD
jgi:nicotinate-nucleotide--dimethylbenzimidazole phosphoribosyltransferase